MDIDVPPGRTLHVNDLPPELLDAIFVLLRPERTLFGAVGDKRDLCTVVLVCRHWRDIALDHLFSDVSFGVAEFTDSTLWTGKLAREPLDKRRILNQEGRYIAVHGLVTVHGFLKRKPAICRIIRRLTLHRALHHFPPWDNGLVKTDIALVHALLGLLPRLEELVLSRMVIHLSPSPSPQGNWTPKSLERLLVDYGSAFSGGTHHNCEQQTAHLLQCFTGLRELTIDGYHGRSLDPTGTPASASAYPPHLRRLELHSAHARPSFLADLRTSPAAATLRHLVWETDAAPPRAVLQGVQALLNVLGPRLVSLGCTVSEPPPGAGDAFRAPPLDLAPCTGLERLRLTVQLASPEDAPRVWARVARMLQPHGALPSLRSVTLVVRGCRTLFALDAVMLAPVEDALLALRRARSGALAIELSLEHAYSLPIPEPKKVARLFPRLLDCMSVRC